MIKVDYRLKRQTSEDDIITYEPKIFGDNDNVPLLVEISAPNSSGKTTFQQILALSFQVAKRSKIDESIREKAKRLFSKHQELTFDLTIDNPNFDDIIHIKKVDGNSEEIVFDMIKRNNPKNSETLTPISVEKKFDLIYDIPNNPLSRLDQIVDDLTSYQRRVASGMPNLNSHLSTIIRAINETPTEKDIQELKNRIVDLSVDIKDQENEIKADNQKRKDFDIIRLLLESRHWENEFNSADKNLKDENEKLKKLGPKPAVSSTEKNTVNESILKQEQAIDKQVKFYYEFIKANFYGSDLDVDASIDEAYNKIDYTDFLNNELPSTSLYRFLKIIRQHTSKIKKEVKGNDKAKLVDLLKKLNDILDRYGKDITELPGVNKSPKELINAFEDIINEHQDIGHQIEALGLIEAKENLVAQPSRTLHQYYMSNKTILSAQADNKFDTRHVIIKGKIDEFTKQKKDSKIQIDRVKNSLLGKSITENLYSSKRHAILKKYPNWPNSYNAINRYNLGVDLKDKRDKLDRTKQLRTMNEKKLAELQNKDKSKYLDHKDELESFFKTLTVLQSKFIEFEKFGRGLKDSRPIESETEKDYYKMTGKYLAEKIGTLVHDGKHKLDRVDYRNKKFHTDDAKVIYFEDLGAGQGMANSLVGMLKSNYNRPLVVLFDETAQMDDMSLEVVYKELNSLYENKKLLCAVIVRPQNKNSSTRDILKLH